MALEPYWSAPDLTLHLGDCRDVLAEMADDSVDAICCDPPYELGFMGRSWDASGIAFDPIVWAECLRVLKPGGHLLAFGGTRTWHRVAVAIEDAGFELRDTIMWIYGSGMNKGINVSKAIDKAAGATREVVGQRDRYRDGKTRRNLGARNALYGTGLTANGLADITAPATEEAARWEGWNTTLKPAHEPIVLARKPLAGTVVETVLEHGTGGLNIAACRVEPTGESRPRVGEASQNRRYSAGGDDGFAPLPGVRGGAPEGRWPTNLIFSHSVSCVENGPCDQETCPVAELDRQSGVSTSSGGVRGGQIGVNSTYGEYQHNGPRANAGGLGDRGGASRFYPTFRYEAKAPASERPKLADGTAHATVKPLDLMRWLVRLITPPGGTILDPFAGSGTTGEAAIIEGFRAVLIELDQAHAELIKQRLSKPLQPSLDLFAEASDGA